jgi:cobaltochelatase CobS
LRSKITSLLEGTNVDIKKAPPPVKKKTREKKSFMRNQTFGLDLKDDIEVMGFSDPTKFTPTADPSYIFPKDETRVLLLGLVNKDRMLLVGHSGVGKTSIIEQIAARLNYSVFKISFDGHLTRNDLVGEWVVKKGDMTYQKGILPVAMSTQGSIIILDEWDTINADTSFVIQRLLQREDGRLLLLEKGADDEGEIETIELHPDNVITATANTCGQGDDTGLYAHGTRVQNYAQLNRFSLTIRMDWLKPEDEEKLLMKKFSKVSPPLKTHEAAAFVKCVNKIRDGFVNHQLSVPLSTRDLINWCEKYLLIGNPNTAAKYCFLNRMNTEDSEVSKGIIQRLFEET